MCDNLDILQIKVDQFQMVYFTVAWVKQVDRSLVMLNEVSFVKELEFLTDVIFELFFCQVVTKTTWATIDPLFVFMHRVLEFDILPPRENVT